MARRVSRIDKFLTLGQLAAFCQLNRLTVQKWITKGALPGFTLPSGHMRVRREDFIKFLREHHMPITDELAVDRPLILLAEDQQKAQKDFLKALKGFDVIAAKSVVDMCIKLGQYRPQVLVFDILMGDRDNTELCQEILEHELTLGTQVLVVTGRDDTAIRKRLNGTTVLRKPITDELLVKKVRELIRG